MSFRYDILVWFLVCDILKYIRDRHPSTVEIKNSNISNDENNEEERVKTVLAV